MDTESTVWLASWSDQSDIDEQPVTDLGVAATEQGAWHLCEEAAREMAKADGDRFADLQYSKVDGGALARFARSGIRRLTVFYAVELPWYGR